jgi:acyl transferase domain-containing protein
MKQELSRREILEMIANRRLSSEEAFKLLKEGGKSTASPLEGELLDMAADVLATQRDTIDAEGDLKDFGFDSITLTAFADRIAQSYNVELMPTLFFELDPPTLTSLANRLRHDFPGVFDAIEIGGASAAEISKPENTGRLIEGESHLVAIIGMGGVMPQADDMDEFWDHLQAGDDLVTEAAPDRWDWRALGPGGEAARWGGFMKQVDGFDADFFGVSPREACLLDPQQRLFLETVWNTIADAGYKPSDLWGSMTGLFVGVSSTDYLEVLQSASPDFDPHMATGMSHAILANRVSYLLNLHGPSQPIDTACSSSLVAIGRAIDGIRSGACAQAIAGGVNVMLSPKLFMAFSSAGMLAKDGRCKTFDQQADGYVRGEGVGAVFLKPLESAEKDGDHIYAVIIAHGENHGGHAHSLTAPNAKAQASLIVDTYVRGGVDPATINYIETHGTGTNLGDPVEINGLKHAFAELYKQWGKPVPSEPICGLGSVKTNIGHLETAAGIASVLKVLLALKNEKFPANCHFKKLNPYLDLKETPFYVVDSLKEWPSHRCQSNGGAPRRAGVSSFGFGGSNAHIVLEEYIDTRPVTKHVDPDGYRHLVVLSADNRDRLTVYCRRLIRFLKRFVKEESTLPRLRDQAAAVLGIGTHEISVSEDLGEFGFDQVGLTALAQKAGELYGTAVAVQDLMNHTNLKALDLHLGQAAVSSDTAPPPSLRDIAYTLQTGREPMAERLAVIATSNGELLDRLERFCRGEQGDGVYCGCGKKHADEKPEPMAANSLADRDLETIANYFISGGDPEWSQLYGQSSPARISLPAYPFIRERFWAGDSSGLLHLKPIALPPTVFPEGASADDIALGPPIVLKASHGYEAPAEKRESSAPIPAKAAIASSMPEKTITKVVVTGSVPAKVKEILAEVLMTSSARIDDGKAFIDLGLDSILGVEFTKKINETFGIELKATKLYDYATIKTLAGYIEDLAPAETPPVSPSPLADGPVTVKAAAGASVDIKRRVREILAGVLFTDPSRIDDCKSFIDLGLDSILGVEFTKKINEAFALDIKATKLYDHSTVNALSSFISGQQGASAPEQAVGTGGAVENEITDLEYFRRKYMGEDSPSVVPVATMPAPGVVDVAEGDVAIIGMSARFPGADDVWRYWENLAAGVDSVTEVPPDRWDVDRFYEPGKSIPGKTFCKWGGFLRDVDKFDPLFFNISPLEAEALDPQQRLFLQEAWRALENAGYSPESLDNKKCGVFVGVMSSGEYASGSMFNASSILAARISYFLNLRGPAVALDTACSSSLVAIHLACKSLLNNETDMMLAGGVTLYLTEKPYVGMCQMGEILSVDGKCKTFDNSADGFVPGEGVGVVVLKKVEQAVADGDYIYGVIKGSGINQDGRTNGITAPSAESQKDLELEVYHNSGIDPISISYVETHGTGTKLGDPIEIEALTEAFGRYTSKKRFCPVGSVKSNLGHTSAASGVASVIKVLLSMKHRQIPPSLHFKEPNEHIDFDNSPFYVNDTLCPWTPQIGGALRAAVSSFGYSGTNAHMVIDEAPAAQPVAGGTLAWVIPLSAKKSLSLAEKVTELARFLDQDHGFIPINLRDIAYTLATGRQHFDQRLAIVASSVMELKEKLKELELGVKPPLESESPDERMRLCLALANGYIAGEAIDWSSLFKNSSCRRVPLPGYPFLRDRYWIEAIETAPIPAAAPVQSAAGGSRTTRSFSGEADILRQLQDDLKIFLVELLKVKENDIDVDGNMSEYGFDSITFTDYVKRINSCYGITYAVESFFDLQKPTIRSLARALLEQFEQRLKEYFNGDVACSPDNAGLPVTGGMPVAIIGMSGRFGDAEDLDALWTSITKATPLISDLPGRPDRFDAEFFGVSPSEAKRMDPQQRFFLETAWRALEDAGCKPSSLGGGDTGVFVGASDSGYGSLNGSRQETPLSMVANRVSYQLDLMGPSEAVDTAETSSLAAMQRAVEALWSGRCSLSICGGVQLFIDEPAKGAGQGVGAMVLKPLELAVRDRDHIYAVIRNIRVNHGGRSSALGSPNPDSLEVMLPHVYGEQGIDMETVDYIEVCGTNDSASLQAEVNALASVFKNGGHQRPLSVLAPQFGDLGNAAGVAAVIKVALAMRRGVIPPSSFGEESAALVSGGDSPFSLVKEAAPGQMRRGAVDAFGYGGTHAHVVLEGYKVKPEPEAEAAARTQVVVLSARDSHRLRAMAEKLSAYIRDARSNDDAGGGPGKTSSIRNKIEDEILNISSETLVMGESGFEAGSVRSFLWRIQEVYGLELAADEFMDQSSVGTFIRYLAKTYKQQLADFFQRREDIGIYPFTLKQMAFTLQLGREEMDERLAIVADGIDEAQRALDGFCKGRIDRTRVFTGNVSIMAGHSLLLADGEEKEEYIKSILKNRKYGKLAQSWVLGVPFDWRLLHDDPLPRRISLPAYPFAETSFWVSGKGASDKKNTRKQKQAGG